MRSPISSLSSLSFYRNLRYFWLVYWWLLFLFLVFVCCCLFLLYLTVFFTVFCSWSHSVFCCLFPVRSLVGPVVRLSLLPDESMDSSISSVGTFVSASFLMFSFVRKFRHVLIFSTSFCSNSLLFFPRSAFHRKRCRHVWFRQWCRWYHEGDFSVFWYSFFSFAMLFGFAFWCSSGCLFLLLEWHFTGTLVPVWCVFLFAFGVCPSDGPCSDWFVVVLVNLCYLVLQAGLVSVFCFSACSSNIGCAGSPGFLKIGSFYCVEETYMSHKFHKFVDQVRMRSYCFVVIYVVYRTFVSLRGVMWM